METSICFGSARNDFNGKKRCHRISVNHSHDILSKAGQNPPGNKRRHKTFPAIPLSSDRWKSLVKAADINWQCWPRIDKTLFFFIRGLFYNNSFITLCLVNPGLTVQVAAWIRSVRCALQTRGISPLLLAAMGPMTEAQLEVVLRCPVKMAWCWIVLKLIQDILHLPFPILPLSRNTWLEVFVESCGIL